MVLTFARTTEVRAARWSEIENLEGNEPLWRIPELHRPVTARPAGRLECAPQIDRWVMLCTPAGDGISKDLTAELSETSSTRAFLSPFLSR
jgi:hypothetical protein